MERLRVVHQLLHDVISGQHVHVDELFPCSVGLVGVVDGMVGGGHQLREILPLHLRKHLRRMTGEAEHFTVAFLYL